MSQPVPHPTSTVPASHEEDWRLRIDARKRRHLRIWLWSGAALTFLILIIGGITRLTMSGLSIVDWQPLMGVIPPLNEADWLAVFEQYRAHPEYQVLRRGMTLEEFQFIYFWEYLHRMAARLIGLVFMVPFLVFWARGYFNPPLMRRALLLFGLGAMQAVMGWLMVMSGLVDVPRVSHYRLAAHLTLAFAIFGCCVWFASDLGLRPLRERIPTRAAVLMRRGVYLLGVLLGLQIVWGAFVAGLRAGLVFNTFPLMAGALIPAGLFDGSSGLLDLFEHVMTVQWTHRVLGTVLLLATAGVFAWTWRAPVDRTSRVLAGTFLALMAAQYLLGVLTLLLRVPIALGVTHQAVAMVIFGVWVYWVHHLRNLGVRERLAAAGRASPPPGAA